MNYEVIGTTMQALKIELAPNEKIFTESGAMTWMSTNIAMDTNFKGGVLKSLGRALSGESLTFTYFQARGSNGEVGFTPTAPGKIIPIQITNGKSMILQKDAFMVAEEGVELSIFFQKKLGTGFFGGEGFIMQKLTGQGMAFAEIDGEVIEMELTPGQTIDVDTSHVAMIESTVDMDIRMVKGFKNVIFGGEGLFLTRLTGPGKIWLQTMTIANLAGKIAQHIPSGSKSDRGMINGLGDLFND